MTDLLTRPVQRSQPGSAASKRPVALAGAGAAAGAAGVGLIGFVALAVAGWFSAGVGSFGGGIRAGSLAWLLANGASLHTSAATITVVPLGASAIAAWLLYRSAYWAGAHSQVSSLRDVGRGTAALATGYAVVSVLVALVSGGGGVHAGLARTALATLASGLTVGGAGLLRGSEMTSRLVDRLPAESRAVLAGACGALGVMLVAGALLVTASLAAHFPEAARVAQGLHAGVVGGALIAVAGVCLLPNAALYAGAFAAGPGFALGTGTAVAPGGVRLGTLPAFPLLAAVPRDVSAAWLPVLVVVPVVAGGVAGLLVVRRCPATRLVRAGLFGGLAGLVGGVMFAALCQLASGAVGPGRMHDVGPQVAATLAVCVCAGVLGGAVAAAGATWVSSALTRRRADPEAT